MTLESNEYQSYILKFAPNVVQKLCDLLGGRGGGQDGPKKDHIIFERSLTVVVFVFVQKR